MSFRILIICTFLVACTNSRMIQTDLYFGQTTRSGTPITEAEWNSFKEKHITRVFIKGSTIHSTTGNWFDPEKRILITEPSYIVSYVYKRSRLVSEQIDSLRETYQKLFDQQAVLRVDKKSESEVLIASSVTFGRLRQSYGDGAQAQDDKLFFS